MKACTDDDRTRVALWRFDLISPLVTRTLPHGARAILLRELAQKSHVGTDGNMTKVGMRTLERYLADYRQGRTGRIKTQGKSGKGQSQGFQCRGFGGSHQTTQS